MTDEQMRDRNPLALFAAEEIQARLERGELIGGVNADDCSLACGRTIAWVNIDEGAPEIRQPDGFLCSFCDAWCCNVCGDREGRVCVSCAVYAIAQDLKAKAVALEEAAFKNDRASVREHLRSILELTRTIGEHEINMCARLNSNFRPLPTLGRYGVLLSSKTDGDAGGERNRRNLLADTTKEATPLGEFCTLRRRGRRRMYAFTR